MREAHLVAIGITEPLVLGDEIVKVRGTTAPMSKDEDGRLDRDILKKRFESPFASSPEAVLQALSGDGQRARPDGQVDWKIFA